MVLWKSMGTYIVPNPNRTVARDPTAPEAHRRLLSFEIFDREFVVSVRRDRPCGGWGLSRSLWRGS